MKKTLFILTLATALSGCEAYNDLKDVEEIAPISVQVNMTLDIENLATLKELTLKMDNYDEDLHYVKSVSGESVMVDDILPGIYTINISGNALDKNGNEYYVNGSVQNEVLKSDGQQLSLAIKGLKVSPLVFKELYYATVYTPLKKAYIYDQFYEIYNNSSETLYLDGLYFANLHPDRGTATNIPLWPEEDGDDYIYGIRVWQFPGSGTDYPLQPGESCVIPQFAVNHSLEIYNPNSLDYSSADFEFYMDNPNYPNADAPDMVHIFYDGKAEKGKLKQYLSTVYGGAYAIFQVPEGESWDPVGDKSMQTRDLSGSKATLYAKIPIRYVLDAVECIEKETLISAKRIPGVLDAGITWVGDIRNGLGVARKLSLDENGQPVQRENGAYIYQDTNNSTDDFERGVKPMLRRNDAGMPAWNHTLQ